MAIKQQSKSFDIDAHVTFDIPFLLLNNNSRSSMILVKWKTRHTFTLLCFFGFATNYCMRVSLSVVIVAMVTTGKLSI